MSRAANSTFMAKAETFQRRWWHIDAADQSVGRLAVVLANILRGKHRPDFTPHCDTGDFVVVTNVEKLVLTGDKLNSKIYQTYSGYAGGQRRVTAKQMMATHPDRVLIQAVKRMIPRTPLGRQQLTKLKVFSGPAHDHAAQQPQPFPVS
ncbi:MAG: 50S ribosomal protein L13 [Gemmataceae bacterium]|jgi:large subunit ribosomal protein L13|nr:50S ribosomal protein L13 [Gemmataceae bacterium]